MQNNLNTLGSSFVRVKSAYDKPVVKASVELLLSIFTVIFLLLVAVRPTLVIVTELQKKIDDQETISKKLITKISQLNRAQNQLTDNASKILLYKLAVTESYDYSGLAKKIELVANENNVVLEIINYPKVSIFGQLLTTSINQDKTQIKEQDSSGLFVKEINLTAKGEIANMERFMNSVENIDRFLSFSTVRIRKIDDSRSGSDKGKVRLTAKIYTYYYPGTN